MLSKIQDEQPQKYYLPLLSSTLQFQVNNLARELRGRGLNVLVGLEEQKIGKALEFANKKKITKVLILGEDEADKGIYKIKDMASGEERVEKF